VKAEYINPFIESVNDLFTTMLCRSVKRGDIGLTTQTKTISEEIVALIGMSGEGRGTVTLTFPIKTAFAIASCLLGIEINEMNENVADTVAEVVNIIAGGAKGKLSSKFTSPLELSLPTVIRGTGYTVAYPLNTIWVEIPFTSDLGHFQLRVTFESINK
jgi:chemotaxis protein CheX